MPVLDPLVEVETPTRIVRVPTIHDSAARQVSGTAVFIDDIREPEKIRSWMVTTAKFKTWGIIRGTKDHYSPATDEEMDAEMAASYLLQDGLDISR